MRTLFLLAAVIACGRTMAQEKKITDAQREKNLQALVGQSLYACADSNAHLFDLSEETSSQPPKVVWHGRIPVVPFLAPLKIRRLITTARLDTVETVALIIEQPNGKALAVLTHLPLQGELLQGDKLLQLLAHDRNARFLLGVPGRFSTDEVESIQSLSPGPGMSSEGVICALGHPEVNNDYGRAGEQWIYNHGKLLIYIDPESQKVSDVQRFD